MTQQQAQLYEGKAKIVYVTDDPTRVIQYFKDDATAFDGKKKDTISGKGVINNRTSCHLFGILEQAGVKTHFVEKLSEREMLCRKLKIIPLEVVTRNVVAGSLSKRSGVAEGVALERPIVEFYYKRDDLGDPMLTEDHIAAFRIATEDEVHTLREAARKINQVLCKHMSERGLDLVDFKLEFGRDATGQILLGDEISPDTCRLWDSKTKEKLDKDRFRRDLGRIEESYQDAADRICGEARQ